MVAIEQEPESGLDDRLVSFRTGYTKPGKVFETLVRLGHHLGIGDPSESIVVEFERELSALRHTREKHKQLAVEVARTIVTLRGAHRSVDSTSVRQAFAWLGFSPMLLVRACAASGYWEGVEALRVPMRFYWEYRGDWRDALECAERVYIPAADALEARSEIPWIQARDSAWFAALSDNRELAKKRAESALEAFARIGEPIGEAFCWRVLGLLSLYDERTSDKERAAIALDRFERGEKLAMAATDIGLVARLRAHKAASFMMGGQLDEAREELRLAIEFARSRGDLHLLIVCLIKQAELNVRTGKLDSAKNDLFNAMYAADGIAHYEFGKASALLSECYVREAEQETIELRQAESLTNALKLADQARVSFTKVGQRRWIERMTELCATLREKLGHFPEAIRDLVEALPYPYPFPGVIFG